jgi:hypothetical protein
MILRILLACLLLIGSMAGATVESYAKKVSSLIDPAKLATLRERGANPRGFKYVAQLAEDQKTGVAPKKVSTEAVANVRTKGEAALLLALPPCPYRFWAS